MSSRFASPVYAIDLRNHGTSPHIDALDYPSMASDIIRFLSEHALRDVTLIGHSLGGKTVMSVALSPELQEGVLSRLVSVDMSAQRGPLSPEFAVRLPPSNAPDVMLNYRPCLLACLLVFLLACL